MAKKQPIVTRESLREMLNRSDRKMQEKIVGRALVRLLQRQTDAEKNAQTTTDANSIGFASCDANVGTRVAEGYLKYGTLLDWQLSLWLAPSGKGGFPRICKYHRQLNEVAEEQRIKRLGGRLAELRQQYGECVDSDDPAILTPIVTELRALEQQLGVQPYVIMGSVV